MAKITAARQPGPKRLPERQVRARPIWTKAVSEFPRTYDEPETGYFLAGQVTIAGPYGETVRAGKGDLVSFPAGLSCT
jgi:uncharacterized protein